jgi:LPXTG-motif cell wall-anchored protein
VLCTVSALAIASPVLAHDLARSESRLEVHGAVVQCELIVDLLEFPGVDQDGNGTISYAELDRSIADVFARVKANLVLASANEPSRIVMTRHELVDEHTARLEIVYTFPSNISHLDVTSTFDQLALRPDHQHYVTIKIGGNEERAVLDPSRRTVAFEDHWWTRTTVWLTVAALALIGGRVGWFLRSRRRQSG